MCHWPGRSEKSSCAQYQPSTMPAQQRSRVSLHPIDYVVIEPVQLRSYENLASYMHLCNFCTFFLSLYTEKNSRISITEQVSSINLAMYSLDHYTFQNALARSEQSCCVARRASGSAQIVVAGRLGRFPLCHGKPGAGVRVVVGRLRNLAEERVRS